MGLISQPNDPPSSHGHTAKGLSPSRPATADLLVTPLRSRTTLLLRRRKAGDRDRDREPVTAAGGMAAALAPGVSRKLKKVLETRTDSPDLLASLGALSTFYVQNTPQARRNLKSSIEQRSLSINRHFLDASLPAQKVRCCSPAPPYASAVPCFVIVLLYCFACRRSIASRGRCTR